MRGWLVPKIQAIEHKPLQVEEVPSPKCGPGEIKVDVSVCGICHTDLHIVEGDLDLPRLPIIPGHQVVGTVSDQGEGCLSFQIGDRVGIAWLYRTCGICEYCQRHRENLCPNAQFTGFHVNGGFAEEIVVQERYAYPLPSNYNDFQVAPLLCAGIVGFRALRVAGVQPGERVGLYGFGASAHLALQVLTYWGCDTFVFSRSVLHRELAKSLGAVWTGQAGERPPHPLHRAIIYAPAGWIMIEALKDVAPGGIVTSGGIHMSPIPQFPYALLWEERCLNSVANATRKDGHDFLRIAAENTFQTEVEVFPFHELNEALILLKQSKLKAAAVLKVKD